MMSETSLPKYVSRYTSLVTGLIPGDQRKGVAVPRNSKCPCGSGKKYKHCHAIPQVVPQVQNRESENHQT